MHPVDTYPRESARPAAGLPTHGGIHWMHTWRGLAGHRSATKVSSPGLTGRSSIPETSMSLREAAAYWVPPVKPGDDKGRLLLLHVLHRGEFDPLGALLGIAQIELV